MHFLFVFQEIYDDDFCQTDSFPSNLSSESVEECNKNNISKIQHDLTVDSRDIATRALLIFSKICSSLSIRFSLFFFLLLLLFFFNFNWWPLCSFIGTFFHNYNFVPLSCLYVFYFIFHINYLVYFCLNR